MLGATMTRPRDPLDGYFRPSPISPALDVLRARAAIGERSHGRITSGALVERRGGQLVAQAGGLGCERIFGPLAELECRCGRYRGAEHAGTCCEKCGVLCGSPALRDVRFAHVELEGGVVHPALAPVIGALLGLDADQVRAVARQEAWFDGTRVVAAGPDRAGEDWTDHVDESGVHALRQRLAEVDPTRLPLELAAAGVAPSYLLLNATPVIPPGDRPLVQLDDPTVRAPQLGPVNEAYRALVVAATRVARLRQLDAPAIVLRNEEGLLQRAFDRLHDAVRGAAAPPTKAWNEGEARALRIAARAPIEIDGDGWYPWPDGPPDPTTPCACLWLDDERLLLQFPYAALVIARSDGRILAEHAVFGLTARSVDAAGRVVFLGDHPDHTVDDEGFLLVGVAVLDTVAGAWLPAYPLDLRAVTVVNDQPEDAFLRDFRTGVDLRLDLPSDRPGLFAIARDHRFVWAGGSSATGLVVNADTAIVHVEVEEDHDAADGPFLLQSGRLTDEAPDDEAEDAGAVAFALTPAGHFRVLDPEGAVLEDERRLCTLAFPRYTAAFDGSGDRLLVISGDSALVVEIGASPRVAQRIDLAPLGRLLAPPARAGLSDPQRDALLQRAGTVRALCRAPEDLFTQLAIDPRAVRALRKAAPQLPTHLVVKSVGAARRPRG